MGESVGGKVSWWEAWGEDTIRGGRSWRVGPNSRALHVPSSTSSDPELGSANTPTRINAMGRKPLSES